MNLIAQLNLTAWFSDNFGYVAAGLVLLIGVAVGLPDLLRLSPRRIWAIGSVGFRESMRRRVLWVTPLAMLGIVAVTQLSHPVDEQDAIRQATKYCLFATGLVVVVATLILACTNLPKEIDNRVIYTIVTKPATRLEIVLGKVVAFARTSAVILLVMGVFSYAYLHVNAAQLASSVQGRLKSLPPADPARPTLQRYADDGLLLARTYVRGEPPKWGETPPMQMYAAAPQPGDKFRWVFGKEEMNVIFPFRLPDAYSAKPDLLLEVRIRAGVKQPRALTASELRERGDRGEKEKPTTRTSAGGVVETLPPRAKVTVTLLDGDAFTAATAAELIDPMHPVDAEAMKRGDFRNANRIPLEPVGGDVSEARVVVPSNVLQRIRNSLPADATGDRRLYVQVTGSTTATQYGFAADAVEVRAIVPGVTPPPVLPTAGPDGKPLPPAFRGRNSSANNQQLRGDADPAEAPVAVFAFDDAPVPAGGDDVDFEFRARIERSGVDSSQSENNTEMEITVRNKRSGYAAPPVRVMPDAERPATFRAPRAAVDGGLFEVLARCRTPGHFVGVRPGSVAMIAATQSFAANLTKSLTILWLLSVLVVIVSIFCSTFVSWPIAVVLSLVILLGRWCVAQLGEQTAPAQIATELFGSGANNVGTRVFTDTVTALNKMLTILSKVLPNLDYFRVTADIERGVSIPLATVLDPLRVIGGYGVPILLLSYLFLRKKEVAP
jgi:ABC-type transport system involved in multi-copper enzyme maturation permease subunit